MTQEFNPLLRSGFQKVSENTGGIESIVAGDNITVDDTDPSNPIVSATVPTPTVPNLQEVTDEGATTTNTTTFSPSGNNKAIVVNGSGSGTGIDITHAGSGTKLKIGTSGSGDLIDAGDFNVDRHGNVVGNNLSGTNTGDQDLSNYLQSGDNVSELDNDAGYVTNEIQAPTFTYTTITGSISSISTSVHDCIIAGSGTLFTTEFDVGDIIVHPTQDSLAVTITRIVSNTDMRGVGFVLSGYVGTGFRRLKRITAVEDQAGTHIESLNAGGFNYFTGERNLPTKLIRGDVLFQNIFNSQSGIYLRSSASDGRMRIGHVNSVSYMQFQGGNAAIVLSGMILESTTWSTPLYIGFENFGGGQVGLYVNKTGNGANQKVFFQTQRYAQNDDHPLLEVSANGIDLGRRNGSFWLEGIDAITLSMGKTSGNWKFGSFGTSTPTEATSRVHIVEANGYQQLRLETPYTPTSTADTNGNVGDIAWDDNYTYVKTSAGWKRSALSTF